MSKFKVGDKVRVSSDTEECCAANDANLLGEVVRVTKPGYNIVLTSKGTQAHCDDCIELFTE